MDNSRFKFRVWDSEHKVMHMPTTNLFVEWDKNYGSKLLCEIADLEGYSSCSDENYIIMQWTGFKDDKGIDIYEGDIIKGFSSSVKYYEVFFKNGTFRLRYQLDSGEFYDWGPLFRLFEIATEKDIQTTIEVIGKIYSNPELLNK